MSPSDDYTTQFNLAARDFVNFWRVKRPPDRDLYRLDEVRNMDPHYVWTIQYDTGDGSQYAVPGINYIYGGAVVGYVTALRPWGDPDQRGAFAPPYDPDDPYQAPTKGGIRSIDFENHWGVVRRKDGKLFEYNDLLGQSVFHVWTVIKDRDGGQVAFPGVLRIQKIVDRGDPNVSGYLLTKRPCFSDQVHAVVMTPREQAAADSPCEVQVETNHTASPAPNEISRGDFLSQWGVKHGEGGRLFSVREAQHKDHRRLWTITYDTSSGRQVARPGFRFLDQSALGFVETEREWDKYDDVADFAPPYEGSEPYQVPQAGTISQEDFERHWNVHRGEDGGLLPFDVVRNHSVHHIWKVVEDGQGGFLALPGMRGDWTKGFGYVKGYILTDRPWLNDQIRAAVAGPVENETEAETMSGPGENV